MHPISMKSKREIVLPVLKSGGKVRYSRAACLAGIQAVIVLGLRLSATGKVEDAWLATRPIGMGLDEEAMKGARKAIFYPAKRDGKSVAINVNAEAIFRLY